MKRTYLSYKWYSPKIQMEEIYRFENGMKKKNGHLCWDIQKLFREILNGMSECKRIGKIPSSMGIDTWAVNPQTKEWDLELLCLV